MVGVVGVVVSGLVVEFKFTYTKKFFSNSERNPLRVEKSGLHRKKSTFRLFLTVASYSPLQKTPKETKKPRVYTSKKKVPVWILLIFSHFLFNSKFL